MQTIGTSSYLYIYTQLLLNTEALQMHPIHSNNEVYFMAYQGRTLTFLGVPWLNRVGKRCDSFAPLVTEM